MRRRKVCTVACYPPGIPSHHFQVMHSQWHFASARVSKRMLLATTRWHMKRSKVCTVSCCPQDTLRHRLVATCSQQFVAFALSLPYTWQATKHCPQRRRRSWLDSLALLLMSDKQSHHVLVVHEWSVNETVVQLYYYMHPMHSTCSRKVCISFRLVLDTGYLE